MDTGATTGGHDTREGAAATVSIAATVTAAAAAIAVTAAAAAAAGAGAAAAAATATGPVSFPHRSFLLFSSLVFVWPTPLPPTRTHPQTHKHTSKHTGALPPNCLIRSSKSVEVIHADEELRVTDSVWRGGAVTGIGRLHGSQYCINTPIYSCSYRHMRVPKSAWGIHLRGIGTRCMNL